MRNRSFNLRILRIALFIFITINSAFLPGTLMVSSGHNSFNVVRVNPESDTFLSDMSKEALDNLDQVFPEYFEINADGGLGQIGPINLKIINKLHSRGIAVIPVITNNITDNHKLFLHYNELTGSIASAVINNNFDGVNLDADEFTPDSSGLFLTFVRSLREKLGADKIITITFGYETAGLDDSRTNGLNLGSLANLSDYLILNPINNYSGSHSIYRSMKAPSDAARLEKALQSAMLKVPKSKLVIGVTNSAGTGSVIKEAGLADKYGIKGVAYWEAAGLADVMKGSVDEAPANDKVQDKKYDKNAYLTFDDGPDAKITPKILDVLKENNVKATFFINGVWAADYPGLVRRMQEEGHTIGNHTYSHKMESVYRNWSNLKSEIDKTNEIIYKLTGEKCAIFRAPGGSKPYLSKEYVANIHKMGMKIYDWNCDTKDWRKDSSSSILSSVKNVPMKKELIIILHSRKDRASTLEALPGIIKYLNEKQYNILPITEGTKECLF